MELVRLFIRDFKYFWGYLKYRLIITFCLSILVGLLDSLGLAMFLPMLEMLGDSSRASGQEDVGNMRFVESFLQALGLDFSLTPVLTIICLLFILKGGAKFLETYYKVKVQQIFVKKLRIENVHYLGELDYQSFISMDVGRIQNTMGGEIERIISAYKSYVGSLQAGAMLMVYISMAYFANAQFAFLVTLGGVISNLAFRAIYVKTKSLSKELTKGGHLYQLLMLQMVNSFKYLKATSLVNLFIKKVSALTNDIEESKRKIGFYDAVLVSVREPIVVIVLVLVIVIQVVLLKQDLGLIVLSLLFFYRSLTFVIQLQTQWNQFLKVSGSLENMLDFQQELVNGKEVKNGQGDFDFQHFIELNNVSFNYGDVPVLKNVTLKIPKNKTVAFVGESGSGKTTLVNMIAGLLRPRRGDIFVDHNHFESLDIELFRSKIGYITQEPVIFNDSIFNNVSFWSEKNELSSIRFWKSLKQASIFEFVDQLPDRENTLLGNNGVNLSGGQRQRLSIARELYKEVDLLIMDEATSALDSQTEKEIQVNIDSLKGRYTILIVAHRLSTIKNADLVVVLDNGVVSDFGRYEELAKNSDKFRQMVELQEL